MNRYQYYDLSLSLLLSSFSSGPIFNTYIVMVVDEDIEQSKI